MAGITAYGAYVPLHRLSRAEIARAWGGRAAPGERSVASYDEDSLTMAIAAAWDCLRGVDAGTVGAVYFASTTAPYREKQAAATIAAVLGLPQEVATADFGEFTRIRQELYLRFMELVERAGTSFAFPTQTVHVVQAPTPAPRS